MPKIVTVGQMRAIEKSADAGGLTYDQMMENAGRAVAEAVLARQPGMAGRRVVLLVGSGNNGGDGLVAGHYLAAAGAQVAAYLTRARPESDHNLARLRDKGALIAVADQDQRARVLRNLMGSVDVLVDALLGTGFRLPLEGTAQQVLATAREALARRPKPAFVVAVDCPSGLDCDSGEIAAETLCADLTVTLAAAKPGLVGFPGAAAVGELLVADIGIPPTQEEMSSVDLELATGEGVRGWLPRRPKDAHKGTFGRAVIVAGSVNYPGAAALAGGAAYRVGAGLVTMAVPSAIQGFLVPLLPEATWILLPHELGAIAEAAAPILRGELEKTQALLLGPGFGQVAETAAFISRLLGVEAGGVHGHLGFLHAEGEAKAALAGLPPCVLDADGLKLLSRIDGWWRYLPQQTVLTPHPGEMAVLTGETKEAIQADRTEAARRWAKMWERVVVLKGAFTVVAAPDGRATVLPFATAALARAGTGDVLAGAIVGLMAQGVGAYEAAVLGGYLHGRAGVLAAEGLGTEASVLAGDVLEALPAAVAEVEQAAPAG